MRFHRKSIICALVLYLSLSMSGSTLWSCGISWGLPSFHFDSVNEWGYLSYWENIGEVGLGREAIPVRVHYLSNRQHASPYVGHGWSLPLLESRMVQLEESKFHMWQPNGKYRTFRRDKDNPNLLHGSGGWKAEIKEDLIKTSASCGWSVTYKKGKIKRMSTPEGKSWLYEYGIDGLVKQIREEGSGKVVLDVQRDPLHEDVIKLIVGGDENKEILLEKGEKPLIQNIQGQNLVASMTKSLTRVTKTDKSERTFSYEPENPSKVVPTFRPHQDRVMTTDPLTQLVTQDNEWTYKIEQDKAKPSNNAAMTRTRPKTGDLASTAINKKKKKKLKKNHVEKEFWHKDNRLGKEVTEKDGIQTIKTWFTGGPVVGKIRTIKEVDTSTSKEVLKYKGLYDQTGILIARYDEKGRNILNRYDDKSRLTSVKWSKNNYATTEYLDNGDRKILLYKSGKTYTAIVDKNNNIMRITWLN